MARHRKKHGKSAKNARKGLNPEAQEEEYKKCPHSFVFHRGLVGKNVKRLAMDMRHVMEPYTASHLKVNRKNVLKDFISVAGPLNVTHLVTFSKSEASTQMRLIRLPRGPTMTFKVVSYSLSRDVVSMLKRNQATQSQFLCHPLLIMNHFSGDGMHLKLMATMFQNMFPSINVNKLNLNDIKRCILLNYNPESKFIDFRHYNIRVVPVGMNKAVKKLVRGQVPNLANYNDISDFVLRDGNLSESEVELDGEHNEVTLPQDLSGRGNTKSAKSAIRLTEIGPRMTLQLIKIEEGVGSGEILYHEYIKKSPEEVRAAEEMRKQKKKLKEQRRKQQEANVKRKQKKKLKEQRRKQQEANVKRKLALKKELRKKSVAGMTKQAAQKADDGDDDHDEDSDQIGGTKESSMDEDDDDDDDAEYYRQEVGQEPDPDIFHTQHSTAAKKFVEKHNAKVSLRKRLSKKQNSKMVTKKSRGKFKKDSMNRTNANTVQENSVSATQRKRPFTTQQNPGKRKKRRI